MEKITKSGLLIIFLALNFIFLKPDQVLASTTSTNVSSRLKGIILLQVQGHGEAWYVSPGDEKRYYLGRPDDAFRIMVKMGLGAKHSYITGHTTFPSSVSGKILIDVEDHGKAYYIYPKNSRAYYLGRPADAFRVMKNLGLGIADNDLNKINVGFLPGVSSNSGSINITQNNISTVPDQGAQSMSIQIFNLTNDARKKNGLPELQYSENLTKAGENHVKDMIALGYFAHNREGKAFYDFADELGIKYVGIAENIAFGYRTAKEVVGGWMNSPGHRANMLGDYMYFGVGAVQDGNGHYYYSEYFTR